MSLSMLPYALLLFDVLSLTILLLCYFLFLVAHFYNDIMMVDVTDLFIDSILIFRSFHILFTCTFFQLHESYAANVFFLFVSVSNFYTFIMLGNFIAVFSKVFCVHYGFAKSAFSIWIIKKNSNIHNSTHYESHHWLSGWNVTLNQICTMIFL